MPIINIKGHNDLFFDELSKTIQDKIIEATKNRAQNMRDTLRYRRLMYGNARWPKWVDDRTGNVKRIPSKKSYAGWELSHKGNHKFYLYNHTVNPVDEYPYPVILAYGMAPNRRWKRNTEKIIKGPKGRFYSTQMSKGIYPWIERQRELMRQDIYSAVYNLNRPYAKYRSEK